MKKGGGRSRSGQRFAAFSEASPQGQLVDVGARRRQFTAVNELLPNS